MAKIRQPIGVLQLSVRSTNCLKQKNIYYIDELVILHELSLKHIPNMGEKSLNEIKTKLNKIGLSLGMDDYFNAGNENPYVEKEPEINIWLNNISNSQFKKEKIENLLMCGINTLSVRSNNGLNVELKNRGSIVAFLKYLFSLPSILKLPNIGKTSELEINALLVNIRQEIGKLYKSEIPVINTTLTLMEHMNMSQTSIAEYREKYQDDGICFFRIIDISIREALSDNELKILQHRRDYWNKNKIALEQLGRKLGVTGERIRQLEVKAENKLWVIVENLSNYLYLIDFKKQYGFYDGLISNISIINEQDKMNFSDNFLYKILSILLNKDYQLVISSDNEYRFLVKNSLGNAFDFNGFINKFKSLIKKPNADYKLDFKGLVFQYFKQTNDDINSVEIESICEDLLNFEFDIVPDIDNQILIKSKKKKSVEYYIYEVLNQTNKPMHLDELCKKIKQKYPEFSQSKEYIGNVFVGNDKFIFFDRSSTYGLKKWEGELTENSDLFDIVRPNKTINDRSGIKVWKENGKTIVRGGTIKNIVIGYLKGFKEPQYIDDIFDEVCKWRETNKHKLVSTLKANNNRDDFVFHGRGYIGLIDE